MLSHVLLAQRLPTPRPDHVVQTGSRWIASSIPMALTDGMRILQSELSVLLLGIIANPTEVGLFRIAVTCGTAAATAIPVINHVAFPVIARLYAEKDFPRLQKAVTRLAQAQTVGSAILTLPLLFAAEPLIRLAFGPEFLPAANAVRIVAAAQLVNAFFGPNAALLNMTHHERRVTRAMAIALSFNIAVVIIFSAAAGLTGAAVAIFVSITLWNVLTWIDGRRFLDIDTSALPRRTAHRS
jgi:O-antigen/teichoic acid export membrane protein